MRFALYQYMHFVVFFHITQKTNDGKYLPLNVISTRMKTNGSFILPQPRLVGGIL